MSDEEKTHDLDRFDVGELPTQFREEADRRFKEFDAFLRKTAFTVLRTDEVERRLTEREDD